MVDDASFFLAPSSTSVTDFYSSRGHHSPASSRSSKRDEKEDEEEIKKVRFCSLPYLTLYYCHSSLKAFPGPDQLSIAIRTESVRGPGTFSHVSDVRIERMVERV